MRLLKDLKVKYKVALPIVLQVTLVLVFVGFYFNINSMIKEQESGKLAATEAGAGINKMLTGINDYLDGKKDYTALSSETKKFLAGLEQSEFFKDDEGKGKELAATKKSFDEVEALFKENAAAEKKIMALTDLSINQSNQFIEQVSGKLVNVNLRRSVDNLQRRMIASANMNTVANFRIRQYFMNLRVNPGESKLLLGFLDQAVKNAEGAEKALANTPYAQLPTNAKKANLEIKELTEKYIANTAKIAEAEEKILSIYNRFQREISEADTKHTGDIFSSIRGAFLELFLMVVVVTVLLIIFSLSLVKLITRPINDMIERAYDLAVDDVDMTKRLHVDNKDEIGELAGWFNKFLERLHLIIKKVRDSADDVHHSTEEITRSSEDLASRTNEQAASITQTSHTLEDFTASVRRNTENSAEADMMLTSFNKEIQEKKSLIENVTTTMTEIFDSSKKIDNIIKVINDISFQTNLLALNAAVEAARAGEAGRGFAVVASEVRNLAQKTAESSKTIQDIVVRNVETTQKGMELVKDTSEFFAEVVGMMEDTVTKISEITNSSRDQSTGIEQINTAISHMDEVSNQNAVLVQELSETGRNVKHNAIELQGLVSGFKVDESSTVKGSDYFSEVKSKEKEKASQDKKKDKKKDYKIDKKAEKKFKEKDKKKDKKKAKKAEKKNAPPPKMDKKKESKAAAKPTPTEDDFFATDDDGFEEF
ncbi:MAG: HAMP domain-containing protein [bacterium]|nr:HAMP domain-containing protein [bacterium]